MGGGKDVAATSQPPADQKKRALNDAIAGAVSGCVARFVVGPLDVLKIRFQVQTEPVSRTAAKLATGGPLPKYTGMVQALATIVREEGIVVSAQVLEHLVVLLTPWYGLNLLMLISHITKTMCLLFCEH